MASDAFTIRPARKEDEAQWRVLWHSYNVFYDACVDEATTGATWKRILDATSAIGCIVAEAEGELLGFINYVIHPRTWDAADACYLEDLYVDAKARGRGVARALCMALKAICEAKGLSRIYWNTREGNAAARALYDQIGVKDDFVRYVMKL